MRSLDEIRSNINEIDREMARLYEMRMHCVAEVGAYKAAHGIPILDEGREREVIERNTALLNDEALAPFYRDFLKSLMRTSREYQARLMRSDGEAPLAIDIRTARFSYPVYFQRGALTRVGELFSLDRRVLVLTDSGVPTEYALTVAKAAREGFIYTVPEGEGAKDLSVLEEIESFMLSNGFTRGDCLVAVGGGVVSDIGGFAASAYMRGIDFYTVPTTLLSMVDASVGGKVAINFRGTKNILGAFYPPRGVLIDAETLSTLPQRQLSSGFAEVIKMALALDGELFRYLEDTDITAESIDTVLYRSVSIKARVVEDDEHESGIRKLLNFGHTFGHAIEACSNLTHGESVALGMLGFCSESIKERLLLLYRKLSLPTALPIRAEDALPLVARDKKRDGDGVDTVVVDEVGYGKIQRLSLDELREKIIENYKGEGV